MMSHVISCDHCMKYQTIHKLVLYTTLQSIIVSYIVIGKPLVCQMHEIESHYRFPCSYPLPQHKHENKKRYTFSEVQLNLCDVRSLPKMVTIATVTKVDC